MQGHIDHGRTFTVTLGTYGSAAAYRPEIVCTSFDSGESLLERIPFATTRSSLMLCVIAIGELGFVGAAAYPDIIRRGEERGYVRCPAEVGPALCASYRGDVDVFCGRVLVGMDPIDVLPGARSDRWHHPIFALRAGHDRLNLSCSRGGPDASYGPSRTILLARRIEATVSA